jgi:hypothetical protein
MLRPSRARSFGKTGVDEARDDPIGDVVTGQRCPHELHEALASDQQQRDIRRGGAANVGRGLYERDDPAKSDRRRRPANRRDRIGLMDEHAAADRSVEGRMISS